MVERFKSLEGKQLLYESPFWGYFFHAPERKEARAKVVEIVRDAKKHFSWIKLAAVLEPFAKERLKEIHVLDPDYPFR